MNRIVALLLLSCLSAVLTTGQPQNELAPPFLPPDARFKADILLIVAHPDDETAIGSYLARAIYDEGKQVAIVYCNRGNGGGNTHGVEQGLAMGAIREIEVRKATSAFGITNVWFVDGKDTPGQDVFQSLANWQHGAVLEQVIRLVRLTRPEVILTWLPTYVSGENHGDHQASGVIATEAFDMAGDPTVFPTQVAVARERLDINNSNEGLRPWQTKKMYYFSDAAHAVKAEGPAFDIASVSPSKKVPYYRLAAALHLTHLTQGDVSEPALEAMKTGNFEPFRKWLDSFNLIFGKSVVKAEPRGEVFEGITAAIAQYMRPPGYAPIQHSGVLLEFGGVFAYYRDFWRAHGIERIDGLVKPEVAVAAGAYLQFPLLIWNNTPDTVEVALVPRIPQDWEVGAGAARYRVPPGESYPVQTILHASSRQPQQCQAGWQAERNGKVIGTCMMSVTLSEWTLPQ